MSAFLDTSFVVAFLNEDEANHPEAVGIMEKVAQKRFGGLHTNQYVYAETVTLLRKRGGPGRMARADALLRNPDAVKFHMVDSTDFEMTRSAFLEGVRRDLPLGFVDWSAVVHCRRLGISTILSFDAGFDVVYSRNVPIVP